MKISPKYSMTDDEERAIRRKIPSNFCFSVFFKDFIYLFTYYFKIYLFIFIQLQLSAFSPHPSTPPQPAPPPSPTSTLPFDFVLLSFIVAPIDPSPHYPLPTPLWLLLQCSFKFLDDGYNMQYWKLVKDNQGSHSSEHVQKEEQMQREPVCPSMHLRASMLWNIGYKRG